MFTLVWSLEGLAGQKTLSAYLEFNIDGGLSFSCSKALFKAKCSFKNWMQI